jgi:hypothetical protein
MATSHPTPLSDAQLPELLSLIKGSDTVELKLTVPDTDRRSTIQALEMDALDAQIRQVVFFDTPALDLDRHGVVARARRVQGGSGDSVVKLRPVVPATLSPELRREKAFGVEVDAMPGGFVCSASLKSKAASSEVKDVMSARRPVHTLFTKQQRAFLHEHTSGAVDLDDLAVLGPIFVLKLKFSPRDLGRRMVAELWMYPDGSRILELSTKCAPADAFDVAAETRAFLATRGVNTHGEQQTKTRTALEFFSQELTAAGHR